jgi:hypothetical protein
MPIKGKCSLRTAFQQECLTGDFGANCPVPKTMVGWQPISESSGDVKLALGVVCTCTKRFSHSCKEMQ